MFSLSPHILIGNRAIPVHYQLFRSLPKDYQEYLIERVKIKMAIICGKE